MLGKIVARMRKLNWDKSAAKIGAFASRQSDTALRVLFVAGLGLVVMLVHREVFAFIAQRRQFCAPPIRTAVAPKWANSQGEELVRIDGAGRSLFDPTLVEQVGKKFENCPWVRKVNAVERVFPDTFTLVDSAETTAAKVSRQLKHAGMEAPGGTTPHHELIVTAVPRRFNEVATILFGREVPEVAEVDLWPGR